MHQSLYIKDIFGCIQLLMGIVELIKISDLQMSLSSLEQGEKDEMGMGIDWLKELCSQSV